MCIFYTRAGEPVNFLTAPAPDFFQAAPAPGIFFLAAPAPRGQKKQAPAPGIFFRAAPVPAPRGQKKRLRLLVKFGKIFFSTQTSKEKLQKKIKQIK